MLSCEPIRSSALDVRCLGCQLVTSAVRLHNHSVVQLCLEAAAELGNIGLTQTLLFLLLDIPAVRTNARRLPYWPVYGIEMLSRMRPLFRLSSSDRK